MKLERDGARVETHDGAILWRLPSPLDADTARWLAFLALPAAIADLAKVPSGAPGKVEQPAPAKPSVGSHIDGQLAIE